MAYFPAVEAPAATCPTFCLGPLREPAGGKRAEAQKKRTLPVLGSSGGETQQCGRG